MILLLKALARLVTFVLLVALALAGLAAAIFALSRGNPGFAEALKLPAIRDGVGGFLTQLESGDAPGKAPLAALLAILAGILLLVGALRRPPENTVVYEQGKQGRIVARRRPLGQMAAALARGVRGVTESRVKVKPKRRGAGGRLEVTALHPRTADTKELQRAVSEAVAPLAADSRSIRVRVRPEPAGPGGRAE
jgi:hypothetical protein